MVSQANNGSSRLQLRSGLWYIIQHCFSHMSQPIREVLRAGRGSDGAVTRQSLWFPGVSASQGLATQTYLAEVWHRSDHSLLLSTLNWPIFGACCIISKFGLSKLIGWAVLSIVCITGQSWGMHSPALWISHTRVTPRSLSKLGAWSVGEWLTLFSFSLQRDGFP